MLTPKDEFVIGFLTKCAEDGLSADEMLSRARILEETVSTKSAADKHPVTELVDAVGSAVGGGAHALGGAAKELLGGYVVPAAVLAPPVLGAAAGYALGRGMDTEPTSPAELQDAEVTNELKRQTDALKRMQALRANRLVPRSPRSIM